MNFLNENVYQMLLKKKKRPETARKNEEIKTNTLLYIANSAQKTNKVNEISHQIQYKQNLELKYLKNSEKNKTPFQTYIENKINNKNIDEKYDKKKQIIKKDEILLGQSLYFIKNTVAYQPPTKSQLINTNTFSIDKSNSISRNVCTTRKVTAPRKINQIEENKEKTKNLKRNNSCIQNKMNLLAKEQNNFQFKIISLRENLQRKELKKPKIINTRPLSSKPDIKSKISKLIIHSNKKIKKSLSSNSYSSNQSISLESFCEEESADISFLSDYGYLTKKPLYILKSIYEDRPNTIFFQYPDFCGLKKETSRTIKLSEEESKHYDLKLKMFGSNPLKCVVVAFKESGFKLVNEGNDWNACWGKPKIETIKNMNKYQKINHFPGCWNIGRKDNLYRHLNKMKTKFENEFDFFPKTYLLSCEFERFQMARQLAPSNSLWIMKPVNSSCGRGIKLLTKKTKIKPRKDYLVSEYIMNPHLINELKYDLRLYVLISSFDPLRIYLYNEGLARFATEKYTTKKKKIKKRFIHLTNYSVNKFASSYKKNENIYKDGEGSKWSLTAYKQKLKEMGIDVDLLFYKIHEMIIKICISVEPFMLHSLNKMTDHKNNCYELYGFDVLIDSNLKPWIMEVNVSPSLNSSSPLDRKIKTCLMCDIMNLLGFQCYDKKKYNENKGNYCNNANNFEEKKGSIKNNNDISDLSIDNCLNKLSAEQWNILFENDEEYYRRGQFERLFPLKNNIDYYSKYFTYNRLNNNIWWKFMKCSDEVLQKIFSKISNNSV